ncbi:reverse transcriptase domain-containing protein [Tanacetum coccineum]
MSIGEMEVLAVVEEDRDTWMTPIFEYLTKEILPADVKKARAVRHKSQQFAIINGTLTKNPSRTMVQCVGPTFNQTMFSDRKYMKESAAYTQAHNLSSQSLIGWNTQQKLNPITSLWPFYKWGIDIAEPFPEGPRKVKFLIVAIDYFTKWIEVKPVATITGNQIKKIVWDNIVYLEINLDLLEEKREQAAIREAKSKAKMEKYYNSKVRSTSFKPGDLVYRNNDASRAEDTGKLGPKWEGPYEVTKALGKGAYKLRDRDGKQLPRT